MSFLNKKIYVAGHKGMVGLAILKQLENKGCSNLILKTRQELDLKNNEAVCNFFSTEKPDIVILAAAKVGGILANINFPAEFLYENLMIQNNVIHNAYLHNVEKLFFLGSSCVYPKYFNGLIKEGDLLKGPLEPTNEGYAIAKITGLKMIKYYKSQYGFNGVSLMPCNLYGTNDSFDLKNAHVLSSLVKKVVDAFDQNKNEVVLWGTGVARREFMHVNDAASAILHLLDLDTSYDLINLGIGEDISILELAKKIIHIVGFKGKITFDKTKSDGMFRKCLDVTRMKNLGFTPQISLDHGISKTIKEYIDIKRQF